MSLGKSIEIYGDEVAEDYPIETAADAQIDCIRLLKRLFCLGKTTTAVL